MRSSACDSGRQLVEIGREVRSVRGSSNIVGRRDAMFGPDDAEKASIQTA